MQEIDKEVSKEYEIKIKTIMPARGSYIMDTSKGKKILKMTEFSPQRILFIHGVKEYLYKNGFKYFDRYMCTSDKRPYIVINEQCFTVTDLIDGRGCNFDNRIEIIRASELLAAMHKASKGFVPPKGCIVQDELGRLPFYLEKRMGELRRLKKLAEKRKTVFDYLFMENVDYFYKMGEEAVERLLKSSYDELTKRAKREGIVCHHDFTHHNIIHSKNRFYLINFDYCCHELKSYDLVNLIRRKMRKCNWDINEAKTILDQYRAVEEIDDEEIEVIGVMLLFPQKFWRIANRYYNSRRGWAERNFIVRLNEVVDEIGYHREFIKRYDRIFPIT